MTKGQSLIEVVVAIGIFLMGIVATGTVLGTQYAGAQAAAETLQATTLAEGGLAGARIVRNRDWFALTPGSHGITITNNQVGFTPTPDITNGFTRTVTVTEIDEVTADITSTVTWQSVAGRARQISLSTRLTDWWAVGRDGAWGDWSDPILTEPDLDFKGGGTGVAVRNRIVYLSVSASEGNPDFYIVDATNPSAPTILGKLDIMSNNNGTDDVAIYEDYAYLASRDTDFILHIVNIADPAHPTLTSSFSAPGAFDEAAKTVAVKYPYVFVGTYEEGGSDPGEEEFWVLNVSNPAAPTVVTALEFDSDVNDIFLFDDLAYVSAERGEYEEMAVVDIINPAAPTIVGQFNPPGSNTGYGAWADTEADLGAFVRHEGSAEFFMLDITNPITPIQLGSANAPEHFHKVLMALPVVYASGSHNSQELVIYDAADPNNIDEFVRKDLKTDAEGMAFERNTLYVAVRNSAQPLAILTAQ